MDHVNRTLLLSLKQDLLSLNESLDCFNADKDIASWLFPTKNYLFVKNYIEEKNIFQVNNVQIFLELIIDRLYVGIRLILTIIHDQIKTEDFRNPLILQPQQMTIGCSFKNLRNIIEIVLEKMANNNSSFETLDQNDQEIVKNDQEVVKKYNNIKCQTDIISMNKCDSCASAMSCMKNLLTLFEIHKADIYQTEQIQSNIYNLTQFGCMMQTTLTIESSLKTLLEKLFNKENENEELNQKIKALTKDLQKKNGKIILLEKECATLNEKNKKNSSEMAYLKSKIEDLSSSLLKSENEIKTLNNNIETLNTTVSLYKNESKLLFKQKNNLSEKLDKIKKVIDNVVEKVPVLERKLLKVDTAHQFLIEEFDYFSTILDGLNKTLINITKNHSALENKVKILYCDYEENATNLSKNFKKIYEKIQQMVIQSHINDVKVTEIIPKIQINGNPVEDISRQIVENKERIRVLENENIKLETIVLKFKNLKK